MSVFHKICKETYDQKIKEIEENYNSNFFTLWQSFYSTVISTFKWGNLPKGTPAYLPEQNLCNMSQIAFFEDNGEYKLFPATGNGELQENGLYKKYLIVAMNGRTWYKNFDEIELCFDNSLKIPSIIMVNEFAEKSTYAYSAVETALERAMLRTIIQCADESEAKKLEGLLDKKKNLLPFALSFGSNYKNEELKVHNLFDNKTNDITALWDVFTRIRNFGYTLNGVKNIEQSKRERLTESESNANDEISRYTLLIDKYNCRIDFQERVKNHFNYDLDITINRDADTIFSLEATNEEKKEEAINED